MRVLVLTVLAALGPQYPAQAKDGPGLLEAVTGPIDPPAIIGRMGRPSSGITVVYDNTMLDQAAAEAYAARDCADYEKSPHNLVHKPATPDAPQISSVTYTCK